MDEMTEARDSWLDNRNVDMWAHYEDVPNHVTLKEELRWMKMLVCVAVGIICVMFAMKHGLRKFRVICITCMSLGVVVFV